MAQRVGIFPRMFIAPLLIIAVVAIAFPKLMRFILGLLVFGALFVVASCIDHAHAADRLDIARDLGPVLAAEQACGLKYDQKAIADYVSKNIAADDGHFTEVVNYTTSTAKSSFEAMTPSSRQVFCTQEARVAKSYGFIPN